MLHRLEKPHKLIKPHKATELQLEPPAEVEFLLEVVEVALLVAVAEVAVRLAVVVVDLQVEPIVLIALTKNLIRKIQKKTILRF